MLDEFTTCAFDAFDCCEGGLVTERETDTEFSETVGNVVVFETARTPLRSVQGWERRAMYAAPGKVSRGFGPPSRMYSSVMASDAPSTGPPFEVSGQLATKAAGFHC